MSPTHYSNRLGYITPEQFQKALDRFDLGDFVKADPIPYGLFGQNVYLSSTRGEFVFRGAPHYAWQFPAEHFFTNLLHQHTSTPVAYPYLYEPATDLFGWSYVIMPRLPGLNLQNPQVKTHLTVTDRLDIARTVANTLLEIQTLTWEYSGSFQAATRQTQPYDTPYRARMTQHIREKVTAACNCNANTTHADIRFIESILAKTRPAHDLAFRPTVVLGDYGEHNLVVEQTGGRWRVSGVFDLMTAHFGDGAADLSGPVMGYLKEDARYADTFIQEYRLHQPDLAGFGELQQLYMLDLTLSVWQYFQKYEGGLPEDKTKRWSFKQWAGPFINYWEKYQ